MKIFKKGIIVGLGAVFLACSLSMGTTEDWLEGYLILYGREQHKARGFSLLAGDYNKKASQPNDIGTLRRLAGEIKSKISLLTQKVKNFDPADRNVVAVYGQATNIAKINEYAEELIKFIDPIYSYNFVVDQPTLDAVQQLYDDYKSQKRHMALGVGPHTSYSVFYKVATPIYQAWASFRINDVQVPEDLQVLKEKCLKNFETLQQYVNSVGARTGDLVKIVMVNGEPTLEPIDLKGQKLERPLLEMYVAFLNVTNEALGDLIKKIK